MASKIKFIDLFAGIGGTRIGLEQACNQMGIKTECVFTSEIKEAAINVYSNNFSTGERINGDISKIDSSDIPDFDFLLGGFPCQAFSAAGSRKGFNDTRGTLFFEVERILKDKKPEYFLLENVEGLVNHDRESPRDKIGRTLTVILENLKSLGYNVSWQVLNAVDFGIPQERKRVYIWGSLNRASLNINKPKVKSKLSDVLESGLPHISSELANNLLTRFSPKQLHGKSIKDKRGGKSNIHSWDIELKGPTTAEQKHLLSQLLKERRKKHWALKKGIKWMDGMPLTLEEIESFYCPISKDSDYNLQSMLNDLVDKGYLRFEHPKDIEIVTEENGRTHSVRKYACDKPKGYNIVVGKLSFEINKILDPNGTTPTLVATDVTRLAVIDGKGLRRLSIREGLRLFGFPETYNINVKYTEAFDLLGNSVVVPVIKEVILQGLLNPLSEASQYEVNSFDLPLLANLQIPQAC